MIQRWWHSLFGHKWIEHVILTPACPERGQAIPITTILRRCACRAVQSAQVMGEIREVALYDTSGVRNNEELAMLRHMAGLPRE